MNNSLSVRETFHRHTSIRGIKQSESKSLSQDQIDQISESSEYKLNRTFDVLLGLLAVIPFAILFPIITIAIKISSKGPVLFKQKRTGKNGVEFYCLKFRTMHLVELKSVQGKPIVTKKGDKRIFKFGQILRKTNLDELPQILNVLKGEMSLVGPRPYPVEECRHWNNTFDDFFYRYLVKPGITGHAQVTGYRGGTLDEDHMRRRLDKDLIYVQKQSLLLDVKIIYLTVKQMITFNTNAH
ncbi:MAG: sugar transferase [Balneolaceae bacterium]